MRNRWRIPVVALVILGVVGMIGYHRLPSLVVVADSVYAETSYAQIERGLRFSLIKQGIRLRTNILHTLPIDRDSLALQMEKVKGTYKLCSPAVTTLVLKYGINKSSGIAIGMGKNGLLSSYFAASLIPEAGSGYPEALSYCTQEGKKAILLFGQGNPSLQQIFPLSQEQEESTTTYGKSMSERWLEEGIQVVCPYEVKNLENFLFDDIKLSWIVPSLYCLVIPEKQIYGLIVDDLPASLENILGSLENGGGPLSLPLVRHFVPGSKRRGGLAKAGLEALRRKLL